MTHPKPSSFAPPSRSRQSAIAAARSTGNTSAGSRHTRARECVRIFYEQWPLEGINLAPLDTCHTQSHARAQLLTPLPTAANSMHKHGASATIVCRHRRVGAAPAHASAAATKPSQRLAHAQLVATRCRHGRASKRQCRHVDTCRQHHVTHRRQQHRTRLRLLRQMERFPAGRRWHSRRGVRTHRQYSLHQNIHTSSHETNAHQLV